MLSAFGLGHVLEYTPFALSLSALHLSHSDKPLLERVTMADLRKHFYEIYEQSDGISGKIIKLAGSFINYIYKI